MIDKKVLDELYSLQQKRAADIRDNGTLFTFAHSGKQITAILDGDLQTLKAAEGAQVHPGMILEQKGRSFCVLSAAERPGHRVCEVAEVHSFAQLHEKQQRPALMGSVEQLVPCAGPLPILAKKGDSLIVPRSHASQVGRVVKTGSDLLEICAAKIDGNVAVLQVKQYQEPQQKNLQRTQARPLGFDGPPTAGPWNSSRVR